eukprot:scaffold17887_cov26-Phaeocystis_antarctica.AAC.1
MVRVYELSSPPNPIAAMSVVQTSLHRVVQLCPASSHSWQMASSRSSEASSASDAYVLAWQSGNPEKESQP